MGERQIRGPRLVVEQVTGEQAVLPGEESDEASELNRYQPLNIDIPQEVLLALGISIASMAGAGAIRSNQATREDGRAQDVAARSETAREQAVHSTVALESLQSSYHSLESTTAGGLESMDAGLQVDEEALAEAQAQMAAMESELRAARADAERANRRAAELEAARETAVGELHAHPTVADARWSDMVRGDTIANFQFTDVGKIQMFFFSVILVFAYSLRGCCRP
ncbi:MAG: hypothetical protein IPM60_15370 [Rhodospirillales bacterium]|nr:hypothetical protein [Rhodospirillales bacterium]